MNRARNAPLVILAHFVNRENKEQGGAMETKISAPCQGSRFRRERIAPPAIIPQSRLGCWRSVSEKHGKGD